MTPPDTAQERSPIPEEDKQGLHLEDSLLSGAVAKWLIPSVTALFATIGYLVQFAHGQLLGVGIDRGAGSYVAAAAEFLRAIPALLNESLEPASRHIAHPWLLATATILTIVGLTLKSLPREPRPGLVLPSWFASVSAWAGLTTLIVLAAMKFAVLDAPLGKVRGVLVSDKLAQVTASRDPALKTLTERTQAGQNNFASRIGAAEPSKGAQEMPPSVKALWTAVVCSRTTTGDCEPNSRGLYESQLRGEFFAHVWMCGLIFAAALSILAAPRGVVSASLAILGLVYGLTIANAYGKLLKSTEFDYGVVRFLKPFHDIPALEPSKTEPSPPANALPSPDAKATEPADIDDPVDPNSVEALILSRGPAGVELLVVEHGKCASQNARFALAKLTWVSVNQVVSIQEIYRQDAIAWMAQSEVRCPPEPPPYELGNP